MSKIGWTGHEPTISELTEKVAHISDIYAKNCNVERDHDWYLLKIQEELGELTADYLRLSGRGRMAGKSADEVRADIGAEAGDLLAHILLFARHMEIDLVAELDRKWFKYLA